MSGSGWRKTRFSLFLQCKKKPNVAQKKQDQNSLQEVVAHPSLWEGVKCCATGCRDVHEGSKGRRGKCKELHKQLGRKADSAEKGAPETSPNTAQN